MDILLERHSVRNYANGDVKEKDLQYILQAAMSAPSAVNMRPWQFLVIRNKETHKKIASIHPHAQMILKAPLAILILGDEKKSFQKYLPQDCSASAQNILLAAFAKKYGAVWCGIYSDKQREKKFAKLFDLPKNIKPFALIVIGKPAKNSKSNKNFDSKKVKYEVWK
jgi:nitroreductase